MAKQTQKTSNKASGFTFGVEIETLAPAALTRRGLVIDTYTGYNRNSAFPSDFPGRRGWQVKRDCSIECRPGFIDAEFVSPVLTGATGLAELVKVVDWIDANGCRVNRSCGVHIHVGYESVIGTTDSNAVANFCANLINLVAQHEVAINGMTGSTYRVTNHYCSTIKTSNHRNAAEKVRKASKGSKARALNGSYLARHHLLNLTNVNNSSKPTVEFRAWSGSTDSTKISAWVQVCLALAERATRRNVKFDAPRVNSYRGKGETRKALDRFFYLTGWTMGRKNHQAATVEADGYIASIETMKTTKKELRRLSDKFDAAS